MDILIAVLLMALLGLIIAGAIGIFNDEPLLGLLIVFAFACWGLGLGLNVHTNSCKNAETKAVVSYFELDNLNKITTDTYLEKINAENTEDAVFVYSVDGEQHSISTRNVVVKTQADSHDFVEIIDNSYVREPNECKTLTDTYIFHLTEDAMVEVP